MLKPKDDLRKDFRLMEFNDIVNQLLCSESESRQRRLNIRLFSVVPLNEECGMIEWLPNLVGLRGILYNVYKQRGTYYVYLCGKHRLLIWGTFYRSRYVREGIERERTTS